MRSASLGVFCSLFMSLAAGSSHADSHASQDSASMKIHIRVGDRVVVGTLKDGDGNAAKDFASLLPLTLELKDYAAAEKISDLPRKLNIAGEPRGSEPRVGDIAYYAPWGNLAIFYKDAPYAQGLVILGEIDTGLEVLTTSGHAGTVTLELAK